MIPEGFRKIGINEEKYEEVVKFLSEMLEHAAEQDIVCCFEATNDVICKFQYIPCCRSCLKPDIVKVSDEPATYYCSKCIMPVRLSMAMYCPECGYCDFLFSLADDVMGASEDYLKI